MLVFAAYRAESTLSVIPLGIGVDFKVNVLSRLETRAAPRAIERNIRMHKTTDGCVRGL